jgi:hypothetical protein
MDRETKAKNTKMSKDIVNDIVNSSVNQSNKRNEAASRIKAALKGAIQRKQDRAGINMSNITDQLNQTVQYGNSQAVLNEFAAKRQNISNLGKLAKGQSKTLKKAVVDEYKAKQTKISNFGALARNVQRDQFNKRMGLHQCNQWP